MFEFSNRLGIHETNTIDLGPAAVRGLRRVTFRWLKMFHYRARDEPSDSAIFDHLKCSHSKLSVHRGSLKKTM